MKVHTSYEVSKRLKEFMGESAPEPMGKMYWNTDGPTRGMGAGQGTPICFGALGFKNGDKYTYPAYCLHDLLSKPFITAMEKRMYSPEVLGDGYDEREHYHQILNAWVDGGMEAVEKALLEMMEAK
jgi:hypothetical protein